MTREELYKLMKKYFNEKQLVDEKLILKNIYPLDLIEFICAIEETIQNVIPTEKIRPENFKDLDSIYKIVNDSIILKGV